MVSIIKSQNLWEDKTMSGHKKNWVEMWFFGILNPFTAKVTVKIDPVVHT